MDPDLALSAVEYAIQLAQHIKQAIKAYLENPAQYENLISRFRTIRRSLQIIKESNNVDFQSPMWGRTFRRIRDDFESASSTLKEIDQAIQSSPLLRFLHAKETSKKLRNLDHKIDILQRDLDLLGFFTFSNAANAQQSEIILHNVQDVKASLLSLEARLQAMERKLQEQSVSPGGRYRSVPSRHVQIGQNSDRDAFQERVAEYNETVRKLYQREHEKPRPRRGIMESISTLQARLKKHAAAVIATHPSEVKSNLLSETCEGLFNQWNLENRDVHIVLNGVRHHCSRSAVYEGSITIRGLWQYPTREARVAIKVVLDVQEDGQLDAVLRRAVALREIKHPNIVSFYGICWPDIEAYRRRKDYEKWSLRYALLVTELMTHNLAEAIEVPALSDFDTKLMVLASISRAVEYLHQRGVFRIAISTKHVMLRIVQGIVVGEAKLSSLWSSYEDMRSDQESLYKEAEVLKSREPIYHQDTLNYGILMCFLLSSKVDHSTWDDRVFARMGSITWTLETVLQQARIWVKGIEPPFLKELAKRCIFNDKMSRPSFKFIRRCIEGLLRKEPLPDLSTVDCGEGIRKKGKSIFYGNEGNIGSPEKAVPYFERAVSCGNVAALVNLGNCYFYGLGTRKDVNLGFQFFRVAAFAGNAAGQVKLGTFYHSGLPGTAKVDVLSAVEMYRRAAIQGNPSAQFKLGCYKFNEEIGNLYHLHEAAALWKLSASEGHRVGQFFIGRCFEEGTGVQRDLSAAIIWYARAAAQGHFGGKWALQRLSDPSTLKSSLPKEKRVEEQIT